MGLNLLEVLPLRFPTLDVDVRSLGLPPLAVAYAAGLTFALAASPCSTPILATLLAYTSTQDTAVVGASLLFVYSIGYVAPLLVAASAAVRSRQLRLALCHVLTPASERARGCLRAARAIHQAPAQHPCVQDTL